MFSQAQSADFSFSTPGGLFCAPQTVTFTQNCTGTPVNFIWNFGNGQQGSSATESITYTNPGTYTVSLTAVFQSEAISVSKTIVINPTPVISLTANKDYLCQPGPATFTATGSPSITSYEWNFGDGSPVQTTNTNSITYNYPIYGNFNAIVKGITSFGCSATASYNVVVTKFLITGSVAPVNGCIPVNALLSTNSNLPPGDVTQIFLWDFGDGSPLSSGATANINHLYNTTAPITTASVTITSAQGCTNQFFFNPFAYGTPPFNTNAVTKAGRDTFCGSENIQFIGKATNANQYVWDFGDGSTGISTDTLVSHKYSSLGNKQVIITPVFNGCSGQKDTINIFIEGVIANYIFSNTCSSKNVYTFNNTSLGNVSHYEWTFTDVPLTIDSTVFSPTHTFPATGSFVANLLLIDSITGCRDSLSNNIYTALPLFSSSSNSVCRDSLISYHVTNTYPPGSGYTYEFHVNGNTVPNGSDTNLVHYPVNRGTFRDYVVIADGITGTCSDTIYLANMTQVKGPVADFIATSGICADKAVGITNNSFPFYPQDTINKWLWDFGDSKKDSVQNPAPHLYPSAGNFIITLTTTDINGCGNKITHTVAINPIPKISAFPAVDTICFRDTAILRAYTLDTLLWTPAGSISCNTCDTIKAYPSVTTSYIAQATNSFGCKTYDTCLVKVYGPINLQVFPSDTSVCPGKPVQFNLNTDGRTTWSPATYLNSTTIKNPVAIADSSITYQVIVADSVGCYADTAIARIRSFPLPLVDAGPDRILPYNTSFSLSPAYSAGIASYLWSPPGTLNCTSCPVPTGVALKSETYTIDVTDVNGCKSRDQVAIFVSCEQSNLLMPTAFTPDNNGVNDYFYPIARGYRTIKTFIIYNRLGAKVFERRDFLPNVPSLGWDGRVKGNNNISTESFVWYIEAVCELGQTVSTKGSVILMK